MSDALSIEQIVSNAEEQLAEIRSLQEQLRADLAVLDQDASKWLKVIRALAPEKLENKNQQIRKASTRPFRIPDAKLPGFEQKLRDVFPFEDFSAHVAHELAFADFSRSYTDKIIQTLRTLGVVRLSGREPNTAGRGFQNLYRMTPTTIIVPADDDEPLDETLVGAAAVAREDN